MVIFPKKIYDCEDGRHSWNMFQQNGINHEMKPVPASVEARDERFTAVSNSASSSTKGEDNEEYSTSNVSDADITRKKKTPMCLINELARHHKVPFTSS